MRDSLPCVWYHLANVLDCIENEQTVLRHIDVKRLCSMWGHTGLTSNWVEANEIG